MVDPEAVVSGYGGRASAAVPRTEPEAALVVMTSHDHILTMTGRDDPSGEKSVGIAHLKARLSDYLRAVRRGHSVTVQDRDRPIARLVPYEGEHDPMTGRRPVGRLQDVQLPAPLGRRIDSVSALLEERQQSR
jgi:prevent-host-death family protein